MNGNDGRKYYIIILLVLEGKKYYFTLFERKEVLLDAYLIRTLRSIALFLHWFLINLLQFSIKLTRLQTNKCFNLCKRK